MNANTLADELMVAHRGHSDEGPSTFSDAAAMLRSQAADAATWDAQWATAVKVNAAQAAEIERLREALEKLARLGNEPHYGNSIGNVIARAALEYTP